ncbi:MAG: alpha-amylase family glycosyl hydrolase [Aggregatilineales bacterium]
MHWTAGLHHDGSALYVSNPLPRHGERVTIKLRIPDHAPVKGVLLRTAPDGENYFEQMHETGRADGWVWWAGELHATMPSNPYRFRVYSDEGLHHYTAAGVSRADRPDWFDFKLLADFAAPAWVKSSVFYQIFPDRFAQGDPSHAVKPGEWTSGRFSTQSRPWDAPLLPWHEAGSLDFYGGDLLGISQKIGYLADLGVNALYLTPIFLSYSNHRYDIADFYQVDPHLGGNEALAALRRDLDNAGMRIALDVTLNHCGSQNDWFKKARADLHSPTADYFTFYNDNPGQYESWLGHHTLPKFNYRSEKLRDVLYRDSNSVLRTWLHEPYRIDSWRLDVANMQGRQGEIQLGHKIGRQLRRAVKADVPQTYIFGEHVFDGTPHLQGDELDATMNYQGFTIPLWRWLSGRDLDFDKAPRDMPAVPVSAEALFEQWNLYRAAIPWVVAAQQFNLVDSHDTPRILDKVGGDKALVRLAAALLLTYPGVPCVYYGDEIGLPGGRDPDNRRPMPWNEREWDIDLRMYYQKLIGLRRVAPALQHGGYQELFASDGLLAFQRQSAEQRLIVVGYRGPALLATALIPVWHSGLRNGARLIDVLGNGEFVVENGAIRLNGLARGTALILEEK